MSDRIILIVRGENPLAMYLEGGIPKIVLEEKKVSDEVKQNYPSASVGMIKEIYGLKDPQITEYQNKKPIMDILGEEDYNPYFGMAYEKNYVRNLVRGQGLVYREYIHDPNNPIFTTPKQFYEYVTKLVESGKIVGWFQGRWMVGDGIDANRCIVKKKEGTVSVYQMPTLLDRLLKTVGSEKVSLENLEAYNPNQALQKLREGKIDVLVINNLIVANKAEDFDGNVFDK